MKKFNFSLLAGLLLLFCFVALKFGFHLLKIIIESAIFCII